jgi:hypothetical protein
MKRAAFNDFDIRDHKAVVEDNSRIGSEHILVGWIDSNFRDLHVHSNPNVTASTRWETFSNESSLLNVAGPIRSVATRMTTKWQRCSE